MKIEAVVTSVNYGDFLAYSLPLNRAHFDRLVVATTPDDTRTRKLCEYWHVECVATDAFRRGGTFRKGAGINAGLARLDKTGWVVHMDADIVLPPRTREIVAAADLDPAFLYGCDRHMVRSFEDWARFLQFPRMQQENDVWVHPEAFPIGVRVAQASYGGYVPIGFFQMWNPRASGVRKYPDDHTDAARGDMEFTRSWPRSRRGFIPEIIAYHLESAPAAMGANWDGRKTPPFGVPEDAPPVAPPPIPADYAPAPKPPPHRPGWLADLWGWLVGPIA